MFLVELRQRRFQRSVDILVFEITLDVINSLFEPVPEFGVDLASGIVADVFRELGAELIV
jgi:hypothetical protein